MDLTREQTNELIKGAEARGIPKANFLDSLIKKGHNIEGIDSDSVLKRISDAEKVEIQKEEQEESESTLGRVKENITNRAENINQAIAGEDEFEGRSLLGRGVGATKEGFGALSSTAYNVLPEKARNVLDSVAGGVGKGFDLLTSKIGESKFLQEAVQGDTSKLEEALQIASDLGIIAGEITAAKGAQDTAKLIDKGITAGGRAVVNTIDEGFNKLESATKDVELKNPFNQKAESLDDVLSPKLTRKQKSLAINEGRVTQGKSNIITGKKADVIAPSESTLATSQTVKKLIPDADSLDQFQLVGKMQGKVKNLADDLKPKLQEVKVPKKNIKGLSSEVDELFKSQTNDPDFAGFKGAKTAQNQFKAITDSLSKKKTLTLDDIWEARVRYDKLIKESVKNADDFSGNPQTLLQRDMWLDNRSLLNKYLKNSETLLGQEVKGSFNDMSNLYNGINNIVTKANIDIKGGGGIIPKGKLTKTIIGTGLASTGLGILAP